jgi:replicative DNA helicase
MKRKITDIFNKMEVDKKSFEFLKTGFSRLDDFLDGGFLRKEFIVLGGATGKGKSFIAGSIFANIATQGFNSAYFSLEISNEMIASRLVGAKSNIKPTRIMAGLLTTIENEAKIKAKAELSVFEDFMSFYDDVYILAEIEKEIIENKYEFVVIRHVRI